MICNLEVDCEFCNLKKKSNGNWNHSSTDPLPCMYYYLILPQPIHNHYTTLSANMAIQDNRGRLMYYLDCVSTVLKTNPGGNIHYFRNYRKSDLDWQQTIQMLDICIIVKPESLQDKCFFEEADMCGDDEQRFHDVKDVQVSLIFQLFLHLVPFVFQ